MNCSQDFHQLTNLLTYHINVFVACCTLNYLINLFSQFIRQTSQLISLHLEIYLSISHLHSRKNDH